MQRDISSLLMQDRATLEAALGLDFSTARIEVQSLLQHVLHVPRAYLLAHPEQALSETQQDAYKVLLQRRIRGEPIAHLLEEREFFGLSFKVTVDTLIPRPETELLVELALQRIPSLQPSDGTTSHSTRLSKNASQVAGYPKGRVGKFRVLDLGTGTGAIALSIAHTRMDVEVLAVDASATALQVARENAQRLGACNVSFLHSDWFSALEAQRFDLIVSNPPYIATDDVHLSQGDVRFEPLSALVSGVDGLDDIRRIIQAAPHYLSANGWLLLEHGYDQAQLVRDLLEQNGFSEVFSEKDIAGIERVSGGCLHPGQ